MSIAGRYEEMKAKESFLINFNPLKIYTAICSDSSPRPAPGALTVAGESCQASTDRVAAGGQLGRVTLGICATVSPGILGGPTESSLGGLSGQERDGWRHTCRAPFWSCQPSAPARR